MLKALSGDMHEVYTGVSLSKRGERISFFDLTRVYFTELSLEEIEYYVDNYKPFDKAGAYGAQDWLGYVGIEKLEGSIKVNSEVKAGTTFDIRLKNFNK